MDAEEKVMYDEVMRTAALGERWHSNPLKMAHEWMNEWMNECIHMIFIFIITYKIIIVSEKLLCALFSSLCKVNFECWEPFMSSDWWHQSMQAKI